MKTGVECEFFLLSNGSEIKVADVKDVASKPCYDQVRVLNFSRTRAPQVLICSICGKHVGHKHTYIAY